MMDILLACLFLGLATAAASITITKTAVTESFRKWLAGFPAIKSIAYLFNCPYCMSHWIAAALVALVLPWQNLILFLVNIGATIAISALVTGLIFKLLHWDQVEIDELRIQLDEAKTVLRELIGDEND